MAKLKKSKSINLTARKSAAAKKPRTNRAVDESFMGSEPVWDDQDGWTDEQRDNKIGRAYNWYAYFSDKKTGRKYLTEYLVVTKVKVATRREIEAIPDHSIPVNFAYVCRMVVNGLKTKGDHAARRAEVINYLSSTGRAILKERKRERTAAKKNGARVTVVDRVNAAVGECISELDMELDRFINDKPYFSTDFDMYAWVQKKQLKPMIVGKIGDAYKLQLVEAELALAGTDADCSEGYHHMKKAQLKRYVKFLAMIVDDSKTVKANLRASKKANRVARKPKVKSTVQLTRKVKYLKEDTSLKLVSVSPTGIVGANEVWTYNIKTKRLCHYVAIDRGGLTIKGTTIKNFDEKASECKKAGTKIKELPKWAAGKAKAMTSKYKKMTVKTRPCNGRINAKTIILKVVK